MNYPVFSGQWGVLHHNRSECKGDHLRPSNNKVQKWTLLLCRAALLLSDQVSKVLGFTLKMVVPHKRL